MNWRHFRTLLWLRWRLTANHARKHGALNLIVVLVGSALAVAMSIIGFFAASIGGTLLLANVPAPIVLYIWDGWVLAFLFFWMIGIMSELQRGEMLSLDKLLHLPTSLSEVYLLNFLSSLVTYTTITLVPPAVGFALASVIVHGPAALAVCLLLPGFVLLVTAVTYQFRGWLASLMTNKRRQRTIITIMTILFVVAMQAPNLINLAVQRRFQHQPSHPGTSAAKQVELQRQLQEHEISPEEFTRRLAEQQQADIAERAASNRAELDQINHTLDTINLVLPFGWLPYGAKAAAAGSAWPGLAGALGLWGLAALSLRRSYRTTLRYYRADFTARVQPAAVAVRSSPAPTSSLRGNWVQKPIPFTTEPIAAVAWATVRGLARAPEVKLVLLSPLIFLVLYGAVLRPTIGAKGVPPATSSLLGVAALCLCLTTLTQLSHNVFGFDRSGFRTYVLSGIARHQILIGKNLALVPLVVLLTLPVLLVLQYAAPAPWLNFFAVLLEIPTTLLVFGLLGNTSSIFCPMCQAPGSLKPAELNLLTVLLQFLFGALTLLVIALVAGLPLGVEFLLQAAGLVPHWIPIALLLTVIELAAAIPIYAAVIRQQGRWLQARECRILERVTEKAE